MTQSSGRIEEPAWVRAARYIPGVHFDADDIIAWRNDGLPIGAIQHEILTAEPSHIRIAVKHADPLVAGDLRYPRIRPGRPATRPIVPGLDAALVDVVGRDIEHAEAALRRDP